MARRTICMGDMGMVDVREGLRLINLNHAVDDAAQRVSFNAAVLQIHCAYALVGTGA